MKFEGGSYEIMSLDIILIGLATGSILGVVFCCKGLRYVGNPRRFLLFSARR